MQQLQRNDQRQRACVSYFKLCAIYPIINILSNLFSNFDGDNILARCRKTDFHSAALPVLQTLLPLFLIEMPVLLSLHTSAPDEVQGHHLPRGDASSRAAIPSMFRKVWKTVFFIADIY